ncbi:3-oxoadipate enol-lactonase [Falsiroseomonas oryzae]|uniref:3-oxoadipate enol-lactonase n=1 Tax=Falsiroseomonas oryzae TaxID=2766473 RepID=UPI0022EB8A5C|nr:3-oxoadipate enol-lactonase [Roseomonas sp. MO-31]
MTPRFATANGLRMAHVTAGTSGPWVVLAHSLASSHAMWRPQIATLASNGFRVLAFDARGHGATDAPPGPYAIATMAQDLRALMDEVGIARAHVVGLSMGGAMAQEFALAHPNRLRGLVIADATSAYPAASHPMWRERAAAVESGGMAAVADGTLGRWFTPGWREANPERLADVRAMILATPPQGFVGAVHALIGFDLADQLGDVRAPTLVLHGSEDQALPPAQGERIAALIPGARFALVEGAAHIANLEQPARFDALLLPFLREASETTAD